MVFSGPFAAKMTCLWVTAAKDEGRRGESARRHGRELHVQLGKHQKTQQPLAVIASFGEGRARTARPLPEEPVTDTEHIASPTPLLVRQHTPLPPTHSLTPPGRTLPHLR